MVLCKIRNAVRAKRVTYAVVSRNKKSRNTYRACEVAVETYDAFCFITSLTSLAIGLSAIKASFLRRIPTGESHMH
jgi:hypothetical protein